MTRLSDAILRAVAGLAPEGCGPRRLVIRFERDGSVVVETDTPEGSAPALETFDGLQPLPGRNAWRLSADRAGVPTEDDLFALHALAASRPDVRFIVKLPPEHVGRRW